MVWVAQLMTRFVYVLDLSKKRRLETRGKDLMCQRCGKPIEPGERLVRNAQASKYYHVECYREMWR